MDVCVIVKRCRPGLSRGWRIRAECADVTRRMIADTAAATTKYLTDYYYIRKKSLSWEKIFDAENRPSLGCYSCRCWLAGWLVGINRIIFWKLPRIWEYIRSWPKSYSFHSDAFVQNKWGIYRCHFSHIWGMSWGVSGWDIKRIYLSISLSGKQMKRDC